MELLHTKYNCIISYNAEIPDNIYKRSNINMQIFLKGLLLLCGYLGTIMGIYVTTRAYCSPIRNDVKREEGPSRWVFGQPGHHHSVSVHGMHRTAQVWV